jgi:hypothetical protein
MKKLVVNIMFLVLFVVFLLILCERVGWTAEDMSNPAYTYLTDDPNDPNDPNEPVPEAQFSDRLVSYLSEESSEDEGSDEGTDDGSEETSDDAVEGTE